MTGPDPRSTIVDDFARWTALSALRSGSPIKSRDAVYDALERVDFTSLFDKSNGPISAKEFDEWHERTVESLIEHEPRLNVGWAAKILNIYLKTRCYIGGQGRDQLSDAIHPPIDGGLWLGLKRHFGSRADILERSNCVERIKDIDDYQCYARIIEGCRLAAKALGCSLIEVEQLWSGTELKKQRV